jgi:NADH dehydrogenase
MKTVEDALDVRRRIFSAFEIAELDPVDAEAEGWLQFVVIGAGPTGVEMAGALAELARGTLRDDFRRIDPSRAKIMLVEGSARVLPGFTEELSRKAEARLRKMGVEVRTGARVTSIEGRRVRLKSGEREETVAAGTILWAAGVRASALGKQISEATGCALDAMGRVVVEPGLTVPGQPEIFVIGDLANCKDPSGRPVPGMAPAAMQQGDYAARTILARLRGKTLPPYRYRSKGMLAVIGRNAAVAELGWLRLSGFWAWLIWALVHIAYLVEFDNKVLVMTQWAWTYFTRKRSARLITGEGGLLKLLRHRPAATDAPAPPAER